MSVLVEAGHQLNVCHAERSVFVGLVTGDGSMTQEAEICDSVLDRSILILEPVMLCLLFG